MSDLVATTVKVSIESDGVELQRLIDDMSARGLTIAHYSTSAYSFLLPEGYYTYIAHSIIWQKTQAKVLR